MTPNTTASSHIRASKAEWGSYALDHDAIDALADLLDAIHPRGHGAGYDCDGGCLDDINTARDALEAALLHHTQPPSGSLL